MGELQKRVNVLAGSHIPVLIRLLESTTGSVLELGCGYNSTPLLYWVCKANDRYLESWENDREWIEKVGYPVNYTEDWSVGGGKFWDIVFIDHRPARKRISSAVRFSRSAHFVVLHDSELADNPAYKYSSIYKHFKYRYEFTKVTPHTMILSNSIDPTPYFT